MMRRWWLLVGQHPCRLATLATKPSSTNEADSQQQHAFACPLPSSSLEKRKGGIPEICDTDVTPARTGPERFKWFLWKDRYDVFNRAGRKKKKFVFVQCCVRQYNPVPDGLRQQQRCATAADEFVRRVLQPLDDVLVPMRVFLGGSRTSLGYSPGGSESAKLLDEAHEESFACGLLDFLCHSQEPGDRNMDLIFSTLVSGTSLDAACGRRLDEGNDRNARGANDDGHLVLAEFVLTPCGLPCTYWFGPDADHLSPGSIVGPDCFLELFSKSCLLHDGDDDSGGRVYAWAWRHQHLMSRKFTSGVVNRLAPVSMTNPIAFKRLMPHLPEFVHVELQRCLLAAEDGACPAAARYGQRSQFWLSAALNHARKFRHDISPDHAIANLIQWLSLPEGGDGESSSSCDVSDIHAAATLLAGTLGDDSFPEQKLRMMWLKRSCWERLAQRAAACGAQVVVHMLAAVAPSLVASEQPSMAALTHHRRDALDQLLHSSPSSSPLSSDELLRLTMELLFVTPLSSLTSSDRSRVLHAFVCHLKHHVEKIWDERDSYLARVLRSDAQNAESHLMNAPLSSFGGSAGQQGGHTPHHDSSCDAPRYLLTLPRQRGEVGVTAGNIPPPFFDTSDLGDADQESAEIKSSEHLPQNYSGVPHYFPTVGMKEAWSVSVSWRAVHLFLGSINLDFPYSSTRDTTEGESNSLEREMVADIRRLHVRQEVVIARLSAAPSHNILTTLNPQSGQCDEPYDTFSSFKLWPLFSCLTEQRLSSACCRYTVFQFADVNKLSYPSSQLAAAMGALHLFFPLLCGSLCYVPMPYSGSEGSSVSCHGDMETESLTTRELVISELQSLRRCDISAHAAVGQYASLAKRCFLSSKKNPGVCVVAESALRLLKLACESSQHHRTQGAAAPSLSSGGGNEFCVVWREEAAAGSYSSSPSWPWDRKSSVSVVGIALSAKDAMGLLQERTDARKRPAKSKGPFHEEEHSFD